MEAAAPVRANVARREMIAAALCLAQFSEPFFAVLAQSQGATEPAGYARLFFLPVYAFLGWAIWRDRAQALRAVLTTPLLMGLIALAAVSTFWSIESAATLRRVVWLALTMGFGLYLAWRYEWAKLVTVIAGAFLVLVAGSLLLGGAMPSLGRMTFEHPGAWSGLWTHKNTLGGVMALGVAACVAAAWVEPARRRLWLATAAGAFALVLLSTSKTALIASLVSLTTMAACALLRRGPLQAVVVSAAALVALVIVVSIVALAPDLLVALLGRDLSLTGRTDIWEASASAVAARPWFGYGYYAFWLAEDGPAYWVRQAVAWQVASAHSSWLELALGLGRVGVLLFALQFAAALRRGAAAVMHPDAGLWAPAFLMAFAMYTVSESHALQANNLFWTIYVAVAARLALDGCGKLAASFSLVSKDAA